MKHGKTWTYQKYGCRCSDCRQAMSKYQGDYRRRRQQAFQEGKIAVTHGTLDAYLLGCRCSICQPVHAQYWRRHNQIGKNPPSHGTPSAYTNYGCRCDLCRKAWAQYFGRRRQAYHQQRKERGQCIACAQPATHGLHCALHAKVARQAARIRTLEKQLKEWTTL